jgi:hypothetical protein
MAEKLRWIRGHAANAPALDLGAKSRAATDSTVVLRLHFLLAPRVGGSSPPFFIIIMIIIPNSRVLSCMQICAGRARTLPAAT